MITLIAFAVTLLHLGIHFLDVVTTEMFLDLNVRREAHEPWVTLQADYPAGWGFVRVAVGAAATVPGVVLWFLDVALASILVNLVVAALLGVMGPGHNWLQLRRDRDEIAALKARGLFPVDRSGRFL